MLPNLPSASRALLVTAHGVLPGHHRQEQGHVRREDEQRRGGDGFAPGWDGGDGGEEDDFVGQLQ